jgi:hypothetical protein
MCVADDLHFKAKLLMKFFSSPPPLTRKQVIHFFRLIKNNFLHFSQKNLSASLWTKIKTEKMTEGMKHEHKER